jgi:hypothetical protein
MASEMWFRRVVVFVFSSGILAASARAQSSVGLGAAAFDRTWALPYSYPYTQPVSGYYPYGYAYPPDTGYAFPFVPPPSRYIAPSFSYNGNPYAQFPNSFSYDVPQNAYAPNSFTYDLRAYGYGYPPPIYYSPPVYPYGYYYPYYYPGRPYSREAYRQLSLREYIAKQLHGPVRVRDFVRGVPELGG